MQQQKLYREENNKTVSRANKLSTMAEILGNILFGVMLILVILLVFSLLSSKLSGGPPQVAGHHMYVVLSGSISPAFDTGSLVFVRPASIDMIKEGDIITYTGRGNSKQLISHRAVAISNTEEGIKIITKGDANDATDPNSVNSENLVGKVVLAIPYLGYFVSFAQTKRGLITLILIPAAVLLIVDSVNLYNNLNAMKNEKATQERLTE